jgi:hypothetical protein
MTQLEHSPTPNARHFRPWFVCVLALTAVSLASAQRAPLTIVQGVQIGKTAFEPGDTATGGNGQTVDGIEGSSREMLNVHIHAHLSIFLKGEQIAVPYGVGIVKPFQAQNGFVGSGAGIYWLHTHDATGIIHIESPDARTYTLGNFFDIWGRALGADDIAGLRGVVRIFVDGKLRPGNPRDIVLTAHGQITIEIGEPFVTPPVYVFPNGL